MNPQPAVVRCRLGGRAPCMDDLCHGTDTTLCGLVHGFDFCDHGHDPDMCNEYPCGAENDANDYEAPALADQA